MALAAPPARELALRVLRLRCPACGRGRVFLRGLRRARTCAACGRALDRDEGHWLGGAEVHMFGTYGASALGVLPLVLFFPLAPLQVHLLAAAHVLLSAAAYRHSRALFLALDFALDPSDTPPPGGERRRRPAPVPRPPSPRGPGGLLRRRPRRRPRNPSTPGRASVKMVGCAAPSTPGPSIPSPWATSTSSRGDGGSSPP